MADAVSDTNQDAAAPRESPRAQADEQTGKPAGRRTGRKRSARVSGPDEATEADDREAADDFPGQESAPESDLTSGPERAGAEAAEDILVDPFSGESIVFAGSGEAEARADDGPNEPNTPNDPNDPDKSAAAARALPRRGQAAADSNPASASVQKPVRRPGSLLDFLSAADRALHRDNKAAAGTGSRRAARAGEADSVPGAGSAQTDIKTGTKTGRDADTEPGSATAVRHAARSAVQPPAPPVPSVPPR